jgi:hypothetical protein
LCEPILGRGAVGVQSGDKRLPKESLIDFSAKHDGAMAIEDDA